MTEEWVRRAFCKCGESFPAWRGSVFFVKVDCCPKCGAVRDSFTMQSARFQPAVFEGPFWKRKMIKDAHWEIKAS